MDENEIRKQVRQHYASAAQGSGCCSSTPASSCCGPSDVQINPLVDYSDLELLPLEGSDLGLGCGMPTAYAHLQPGERVLDLGSGAGIDVFLAARQVGESGHVIGVDMTPEMIARARENAARSGLANVEFRLGEIEHLPIESASIDAVLSNCVINLVPDKRRAFAEICRVLKPGGRFVISDMVTFGAVPASVRQDLELWAGCVAGALDKEEYLETVRQAGFGELHIHALKTYSPQETGLPEDSAGYGIASLTLEGRRQ